MRKIFATIVLVGVLLVPPQVVLAEYHDYAPPWFDQVMKTQMMLQQFMMKSMKSKKRMMTPAQDKKLMKMLKELEKLLREAG